MKHKKRTKLHKAEGLVNIDSTVIGLRKALVEQEKTITRYVNYVTEQDKKIALLDPVYVLSRRYLTCEQDHSFALSQGGIKSVRKELHEAINKKEATKLLID